MEKILAPTTSELAAYFSGNASLETIRKIEAWVQISESNKQLLIELELVWNDTGIVNIDKEILNTVYDVDIAWEKVKKLKKSQTDSNIFKWVWRIAAVLFLGVLIGTYSTNYLSTSSEIVFQTDSLQKSVQLADGSSIQLNSSSQITYPKKFVDNVRKVKMDGGEAFFEVKRDVSRPFIVETRDAIIEVLGTSFNVEVKDQKTTVTVKSGKVSVSNTKKEIILKKGDRGIYDANTQQLTAQKSKDLSGTAAFWHTRSLSFSGQSLTQVVQDLSEVYEVNISLGNSALKNCRLSATFKDEPITEILDIIALTLDLQVEKDEKDQFILTGEGC